MKPPCFNEEARTDCPKRHAGCAVDCPDWAKYVEARDAEYERRKQETAITSAMLDRRNRSLEKRYRRDIHYKRSHRRGHID